MEPPEFFRCQTETIGSIVQISVRIISLFRKLLCRKVFPEGDETGVTGLAVLGKIAQPTAKTTAEHIEKLVCLLYQPKTLISNVKEEQCSTNRCHFREAGLKCTKLQ